MSNYTTQLRFICESITGNEESVGFAATMEVIEESVDRIFSFDWPIFDEAYRVPLEVKIVRHFYTREIGEETFGLWQLRLCDRLNVIMPYYNQLYESELIKFNPLWDVDLHTEHEKANDGNLSTQNNSSSVKHETRDRVLDKNEINDGTVDTDFTGDKRNITSTDQTENVDRNSVTDTTNVGVWDSETSRSNVATNQSETSGNRKNKNVNRYSDTPQGNVDIGGQNAGNVDVDSVFGNGYLTNVTVIDDNTDRIGREKGENTNDSVEQGKTIQDWTKQDKVAGSSDRNLSGMQEDNSTEKNSTKTLNSNILNGNENEGIVGDETVTNTGNLRTNNFSTEDFIQHVWGKRGGFTYSKMLDDFRKTFLNIDRMILKDLESLFIGLWE